MEASPDSHMKLYNLLLQQDSHIKLYNLLLQQTSAEGNIACLAQLVEHFISNEEVRGSSPRSGFSFSP